MKFRGALSLILTLDRSRSSFRSFCSEPSSAFGIKNVTRSNFESALEDLRKFVRGADFVAIDLEMTGIYSAPWRETFEFDRADIRYLKIKDSAEKFAVVQFGVCPFRWDQSKQGFVAHPHNFYIFPRHELPVNGTSHEFFCQISSIDFLAKFQFDFNTCIHEGVSYISHEQEGDALRCLDMAYNDKLSETCLNSSDVEDIPLVNSADVLFTKRMKEKISEWHAKLLQKSSVSKFTGFSSDSKQKFQTTLYRMRPALSLTGFTSHQMKLIQLVTKKYFDDLTYVRVNGDDSSLQHLLVYTKSKDEKSRLLKEVKDELHKEAELKVEAAIGFRQVIDLLSSEKKLIVGHNCCLDFAHIHNKFIAHLPSTTKEFMSSVHEHFPYIMDTKIILNADTKLHQLMGRKGTSLSKAFSLLCPHLALRVGYSGLGLTNSVEVEVQVDDMSSYKWNSGAKHEAGYDAFMTGCIFAQSCARIGVDFNSHLRTRNLAYHEKLHNHVNRLYLSWDNGEIVDLKTNVITKKYSRFSFSNIAMIWGYPYHLRPKEIKECVCRAFGPTSVSSIFILDASATVLMFANPKLASQFLDSKKEALETKDGGFNPLLEVFEGGNTEVAGYGVYKEICKSRVSEVLFADQARAVGVKWDARSLEECEEGDEMEEVVLNDPSCIISQLMQC